MLINFLTIFPHIFDSYLNESILARARKKGLIKFKTINLRDYTYDKHKTVDDKPYGGGPGMVMKVEPIFRALRALKMEAKKQKNKKTRILLLSAKGKIFTQKDAARLSKYNELTFICGRYEGIDERVKKFVDKEISVGPYVLTGGELPALVIADAVIRLLPGVIRKESLKEESHSLTSSGLRLTAEYPQYTRPEIFEYKEKSKKKILKVPTVLLSGDHQKIKEWRKQESKKTEEMTNFPMTNDQ